MSTGNKFHRYCIPMEGSRPLLSTELEFFNKGTGKGKVLTKLLGDLPKPSCVLISEYSLHSSFDCYIHKI